MSSLWLTLCGLDIFPGAVLFLQDMEPDIRTNSISSLSQFLSSKSIDSSYFLTELIPIVNTSLLSDPVPEVRKAFADVCVDIAIQLTPGT